MSENVVILGAASGIARPLCRLMAARGCRLVLAGRSREELEKMAADLRVRFSSEVFVELFEALDFDSHAAFFQRCLDRFGGELDGVVLCHGWQPDQQTASADLSVARRAIDVNFTSAVSLLGLAANYLEPRRKGYLAAISSVAGDRGRQSNYTYGAAKAGLSAYLAGLRHRLHRAGVRVICVKPGMVATRMTADLVDAKARLVAQPETVARDIDRAIRKRKSVLYTPWFWRPIMAAVRWLPESQFLRTRL